jgi:hypothetical protein
MDKRPSDHPELFNSAFDDFNREVVTGAEPPPQGGAAKPQEPLSALNLLLEKLDPGDQVRLTQAVRAGHLDDNDPYLIGLTAIQFNLDAIVEELRRAEFQVVAAVEELKSAEVGLGKYREQQQQLTEETKTRIVETNALLNVLGKTREAGSAVLDAQLKAAMFKTALCASVLTAAADLLIRLTLALFH